MCIDTCKCITHSTMPLGGATGEEVEFHWGRKGRIGGANKDVQFYESFTYDGLEYALYDCVYIWRDGEPEPDIGKIVRIWETPTRNKKVKVVWFFQPAEIRNFLGDVAEPLEKEVFLASGEGKGLSNINPLEAISGKCNVVCISSDERNPQPSRDDVRMADFIFYRTFDVVSCKISPNFAAVTAGIEVKHFFNREKDQKLVTSELAANLEEKNANSSLCRKVEQVTTVRNPMKDGKSNINNKPVAKVPEGSKIPTTSLGKQTFRNEIAPVRYKPSIDKVCSRDAKIPCSQVADKGEIKYSDRLSPTISSDIRPPKKRKLQFSTVGSPAKLLDTLPRSPDLRVKPLDTLHSVIKKSEPSEGVNFDKKARKISDISVAQLEHNRGDRQFLVVTSKPNEDTNKWFRQQPWEGRMKRAYEKGTLVLLQNLDPSFTSSEVEDLVWHALKAKVDAKMLQRSTFSSPYYGQAFVIFKSKDAAELAISELNRKCLMLASGRPVVAGMGSFEEPSKPGRFVGHLVIDKIRFQKQREEMKNAVSTSHYSQPNTIEYEMALEWRVLQEKSNLWWEALNEKQAKEIEALRSQLKIHHDG